MKKIIFITWALEVGGAERLLVKLAQNIPLDRYEVKVVCVTRKGVWAEELETRGIPVVSMGKKVGLDIGVLFRLKKYLRKEQPDIVNTSIWTADLWGRGAAILAGVPHIIVTEQNVDIWKKWYHRIIDRILFRWTEFVICVSEDVKTFYHDQFGVPSKKLRMIPNAIDLELFNNKINPSGLRKKLGISDDKFIFVCPARLHSQKAHQVLIEAAYSLIEKGNEKFKILLVGEGERRQELEQLVAKLSLEEVIFFMGLRHDIPDILMQSDAFLLSSDYEGLSLAILEGMAARLPIIATQVGGNSQLVENEKNGYLVPARDSDALADAMSIIMSNRAVAQSMGAHSRRVVEGKYSIKSVAKQTLELFDECMAIEH